MSIIKRKSKNGMKYFAQICVNGQRISKTFGSLSEAAKWEEETTSLLRSGKAPAGETVPGDILFKEASDRAIQESSKALSRGQRNIIVLLRLSSSSPSVKKQYLVPLPRRMSVLIC